VLSAIQGRHDLTVDHDACAVGGGQETERVSFRACGQRHGDKVTSPLVYRRELLDQMIGGAHPYRHQRTFMSAKNGHWIVRMNCGPRKVGCRIVIVDETVGFALLQNYF